MGNATEETLRALKTALGVGVASLGPQTPASSLSVVSALSATGPVSWQVPVTTAARALLTAWSGSVSVTAGEATINGANMYICRTSGTTASSGGPTGTGTNIGDGTAAWDFVMTISSTSTAFRGALVLTNQQTSASAVYYGSSAALAGFGMELLGGKDHPLYCADPTLTFVATATSTARVCVTGWR